MMSVAFDGRINFMTFLDFLFRVVHRSCPVIIDSDKNDPMKISNNECTIAQYTIHFPYFKQSEARMQLAKVDIVFLYFDFTCQSIQPTTY